MATTEKRTSTEITRREIQRLFARQSISWSGDLNDVEFLSRLYDLQNMPSTDSRFHSAAGDIWQHRINNFDWDDDWIFHDDRLQLADGPDETLLRFLAEIVHPVVREDRQQSSEIVRQLNELLASDGWKLSMVQSISGWPIYGPKRLDIYRNALSSAKTVAERVDADYVHRQISRMLSAIDTDPELAIGTAKELIETICRTILDSRGQPVTDKPDLLPLARRALDVLKLVPDGISEEAKGSEIIRRVLGNLSTIVQGLSELRNLYGTGHGKSGESKGLAKRHARLAVGAASTFAAFLIETHEERTR